MHVRLEINSVISLLSNVVIAHMPLILQSAEVHPACITTAIHF